MGGSYGQGALRVGGRTGGYYRTTSASVGLLAGADSKAVYVLFMTQESLDRFRASKGWTAGADASVTMIKVGASIALTALRAGQIMLVKASIAGAIVTNTLFMLGASFLLGGLKHHVQEFNRVSARMQAGLLFLATVALLFPTLGGVTVLVALVSDVFVESVQKAADAFGMTPAFVGFIVVSLVGGAAEMSSAALLVTTVGARRGSSVC